ncbi:MAG: hypothetical protein A3G23_05290 [Bacteroidetes bacterium RIFCSPLOWO2_12_FULL_37_12]|nr:MAG: hypothetical protein A3G23_05290 [Bacteroidetes bacterium RIFCSPLOWO2_12_FULL_37_12]
MKNFFLLFFTFFYILPFSAFPIIFSDTVSVTYLRSVLHKKTSTAIIPVSHKIINELDFYNFLWSQQLSEKYELFRLPFYFHSDATGKLFTFENNEPNTDNILCLWNSKDSVNSFVSFSINVPGKNEKGEEGLQKIDYQVTYKKSIVFETDTLFVLLFSTTILSNLDYKIILNSKAEFCGFIDVDDLSSGYIAVDQYLDAIRKYYYDEDWW